MTTLHLGVFEFPYQALDQAGNPTTEKFNVMSFTKKGKPIVRAVNKKGRSVASAPKGHQLGTETTGDVATIIEDHYGIMQAYVDRHANEIAADMADALNGSLERVLSGEKPLDDPFAGAMQKLEAGFKHALSQREFDGLRGVPTKAAREGVSARFKSGYGPKDRPSFIDTGLFQSSFHAWIE